MGGCLSRRGRDCVSSFALVISPEGELRPYSTPVFVSDVLQMDSCFSVCNSDDMSYDEHIMALDAHDELDAGQIYFVLPVSKLRHPLSASEMAALAVKASVALNTKPNYRKTLRCKVKSNTSKVYPFLVMERSKINVIVDHEVQNKQGYLLMKDRLDVRSFKFRLSTIYETESYSSDQFTPCAAKIA